MNFHRDIVKMNVKHLLMSNGKTHIQNMGGQVYKGFYGNNVFYLKPMSTTLPSQTSPELLKSTDIFCNSELDFDIDIKIIREKFHR